MMVMVMMMPVVVTFVMLFVTGHRLDLRRLAVRHQHVERESQQQEGEQSFHG